MPSVGRPRKAPRTKADIAVFAKQALEKFRTENSHALEKATLPDVLSALAVAACDLPPGVVRELIERFPTNEACLNYLRDRFYPNGTPCPKCGKPSRFHKIKGRSAYSCQHC